MIVRDLYLDPVTHDLVIENGDIRFTRDGEITLQKIKTRFLFFTGDSFLNPEEGVDYLKYVFTTSSSEESIRNLFIKELQAIPEIAEIIEVEILRQEGSELINVSFKVKDRNGFVIEGAV
jgi:hypothetical protein